MKIKKQTQVGSLKQYQCSQVWTVVILTFISHNWKGRQKLSQCKWKWQNVQGKLKPKISELKKAGCRWSLEKSLGGTQVQQGEEEKDAVLLGSLLCALPVTSSQAYLATTTHRMHLPKWENDVLFVLIVMISVSGYKSQVCAAVLGTSFSFILWKLSILVLCTEIF